MRLLFIITGSIAVSKSHEILEKIKQKNIKDKLCEKNFKCGLSIEK
tara:strand:+ start:749 stop:886 length:138 start_codon:yes stop_codon:yes gene_type:complete